MQKTAFMLRQGCVISTIVGRDTLPTAFQVGEEFYLSADLDLAHLGIVPKHTGFTVESHDHDTGIVSLKSKCDACALKKWGQCVVLQPFETDDIVTRLVKTRLTTQERRVLQIAAVIALVALMPAPWNWTQAAHAVQAAINYECSYYDTQ